MSNFVQMGNLMKDTTITITAAQKKKELIILLICFIIAESLNIISIVTISKRWIELISQSGFVVAITTFLYVSVAIIRFIIYFIKKKLIKK